MKRFFVRIDTLDEHEVQSFESFEEAYKVYVNSDPYKDEPSWVVLGMTFTMKSNTDRCCK